MVCFDDNDFFLLTAMVVASELSVGFLLGEYIAIDNPSTFVTYRPTAKINVCDILVFVA